MVLIQKSILIIGLIQTLKLPAIKMGAKINENVLDKNSALRITVKDCCCKGVGLECNF